MYSKPKHYEIYQTVSGVSLIDVFLSFLNIKCFPNRLKLFKNFVFF